MFVVFALYGLCFMIRCSHSKDCIARKYDQDSVVCVCNATYCDEIPHLETMPAGHYVAYESTMEGLRFEKTEGIMRRSIRRENEKTPNFPDSAVWRYGPSSLRIMRNKKYQEIVGFGGAFTDATGINIASLSKQAQDKLLKSYFSNEGIEYNMGRVIIGSSDFSTHVYSYQDFPQFDKQLTNFSLTVEDYEYKIPYIKEAEKHANCKLNLIASSWSAPTWLKGGLTEHEQFRREYYQTWAEYHIRFLDEYDKNNITFWGITTGNEVFASKLKILGGDVNQWFPKDIANWIERNFGPTIRNSKYSNLLIFGLDDFRFHIPFLLLWIFTRAFDYVDGIATHWYVDYGFVDTEVLHLFFPNKMLLSTESSEGFREFTPNILLGSWFRAEIHVKNMISYFNHWNVGWIDWNMALNGEGGPRRTSHQADSPIIIFEDKDEFVKQPMFYALGHFSKFIPRGSRRIKVKRRLAKIDHVAFLRPDDGIVVIFYNSDAIEKNVTIEEENKGIIEIPMKRKSIYTVVYW